jgi:prevent-host-death family protein
VNRNVVLLSTAARRMLRPAETLAALPPVYMTAVVTSKGGAMREIQLREAKATLSAVVDEAVRGQPSVITRHGKPEAVVLSFEGRVGTSVAGPFLRPLADGGAGRA